MLGEVVETPFIVVSDVQGPPTYVLSPLPRPHRPGSRRFGNFLIACPTTPPLNNLSMFYFRRLIRLEAFAMRLRFLLSSCDFFVMPIGDKGFPGSSSEGIIASSTLVITSTSLISSSGLVTSSFISIFFLLSVSICGEFSLGSQDSNLVTVLPRIYGLKPFTACNSHHAAAHYLLSGRHAYRRPAFIPGSSSGLPGNLYRQAAVIGLAFPGTLSHSPASCCRLRSPAYRPWNEPRSLFGNAHCLLGLSPARWLALSRNHSPACLQMLHPPATGKLLHRSRSALQNW